MTGPRVVIVGGGFGGLYCARALQGAGTRITLFFPVEKPGSMTEKKKEQLCASIKSASFPKSKPVLLVED